jgi:hypothetical protein
MMIVFYRVVVIIVISAPSQQPSQLPQNMSLTSWCRWCHHATKPVESRSNACLFLCEFLCKCDSRSMNVSHYWQFTRYPIPPSLSPNIFSGFGLPGDNLNLNPKSNITPTLPQYLIKQSHCPIPSMGTACSLRQEQQYTRQHCRQRSPSRAHHHHCCP